MFAHKPNVKAIHAHVPGTKPDFRNQVLRNDQELDAFNKALDGCHDPSGQTVHLIDIGHDGLPVGEFIGVVEDLLRNDMWVGTILATKEDKELLESLGIIVGDYSEEHKEFMNCRLTPLALEKLDPYWGRFVWSLN